MTPTEITDAYAALGRAIAARAGWAAITPVPRGEGADVALVLDGTYFHDDPADLAPIVDHHAAVLGPLLTRAVAARQSEDDARLAPTAESRDAAERLAALALSRDDLDRLPA